MILIAVVVGYILGIAPYIYSKFIEKQEQNKQIKQENSKEKEATEIFNEWLNGPEQKQTTQVDQADIYNEYMTGIVKKGE